MATTPLSSPDHGKQRLAAFNAKYPRSAALRIQPIQQGGQGASGTLVEFYDCDDVAGALGATRYAQLLATVKQVHCIAHRLWPSSHAEPTKRGAEVHCILPSDLEAFLAGGH